ncbi:hypothetical protein ACSQ67_018133 [Phaseolus vulgaris]
MVKKFFGYLSTGLKLGLCLPSMTLTRLVNGKDYGERISFEENVGYGAGASKDSKVDDFTKDGLQNPSKSLRVDVAKVDFSTSKKTEVTPKDVLVRLTNIVGNINRARVATQQSTP